MSTTTHKLMGGKLNLYKRDDSKFWQCSALVQGRNRRASTKEESLAAAKDVAQDWFLGLQGKVHSGENLSERTFAEAAKIFEKEYETITGGVIAAQTVECGKSILQACAGVVFVTGIQERRLRS